VLVAGLRGHWLLALCEGGGLLGGPVRRESPEKTHYDLSPVRIIIYALGVAFLLQCVPGTIGLVGGARAGRGLEGAMKELDSRSGRRGGRDGVFALLYYSIAVLVVRLPS
jgi:hypothetical protein